MIDFFRNCFTTSLSVYVGTLLCATISFIISLFFGENNNVAQQLFSNLSYGIAASVIVAMMIDFGNTKRNHQENKLIFDRLKSHLEMKCDELRYEMLISVYEAFGENVSNEKRTFEKWTKILFNCEKGYTEDQEDQMEHIVEYIQSILKTAAELKSTMYYYLSNECVTEEFESKLERLIKVCYSINREYREGRFDKCQQKILEDLEKSIFSLFENLRKSYLEEKYNEDEYEDL